MSSSQTPGSGPNAQPGSNKWGASGSGAGRGGGNRDRGGRGGNRDRPSRGGISRGDSNRGSARGGRGGSRGAHQQSGPAEEMLRELNHFMDGTPRGGDRPSSIKEWLKSKRCMILVSNLQGLVAHVQLFGGEENKVWFNYDTYSQNPKLVLRASGHAFHIGTELMSTAITRQDIEGKDMTKASLIKLLAEALDIRGVSDADIELIRTFAKEGLSCLSLGLQSGVSMTRLDKAVEGLELASTLLTALNTGSVRLAVLRKAHRALQALDPFWDGRLKTCLEKGIYPHYASIMATMETKKLGEVWDEEIPRQTWMDDPKADVVSYKSHPAICNFSSFREYKVVMTMALMLESAHRRKMLNKYFNHTVLHDAIVRAFGNGYVQFYITLSQQDESTKPAVANKASFKLRLPSNPTAMDVDSAEAAPAHTDDHVDEWDCQVVLVETTADFAVSAVLPPFLTRDWKNGKALKVSLSIVENVLPELRQVDAIAQIASRREDDNFSQLLLGKGYAKSQLKTTPSLLAVSADMVNDKRQALLDRYLEMSSLNREQNEIFETVFSSQHGVALIQGPPGTGKTTMNAFIAVYAALRGIPVLATAPTNVAAAALSEKISLELLTLDEKERRLFKIVYFPTMTQTHDSLRHAMDDVQEGTSAVSGDISEQSFHLWWHLVELTTAQARNGDSDARWWGQQREFLANGLPLQGENAEKKWRRLTWEYSVAVFQDPDIKIVICTCNNAAHEIRQAFQPWLSIVDEAAFGVEADVLIPLTSHIIKMVLLSGDHEQLAPIVTSVGDNEYAEQIKTSIFERLVRENGVAFTQLKINFRMHPVLADLPGTLCYTGLDCGEQTKQDQQVFLAWSDFWNDPSNAALVAARRPATTTSAAGGQIRRLFFNVAGHSGAMVGNTSQHNYANINVIVDLLRDISHFVPSGNIGQIDQKMISILVPYGAQLSEMIKQLGIRIPGHAFNVSTIDSFQSGQAEMAILDLSTANSHHGSILGFLRDWHRMNVALTRAKQVLIVVGNLDLWLQEIEVVDLRCAKWALFIMDLIDRGDIIDMAKVKLVQLSLPADRNEVGGVWTLQQEPSEPLDLANREKAMLLKARQGRAAFMEKLLAKLNEMRGAARKALEPPKDPEEKAEKGAGSDEPERMDKDRPGKTTKTQAGNGEDGLDVDMSDVEAPMWTVISYNRSI